MFANRYTAVVDACSLAGALPRNLLLTLAEAEFFRLRWSAEILAEVEKAITSILQRKEVSDAAERAARARAAMQRAFADADAGDYSALLPACGSLPDPKDAHVLAAALKTQAAVIVTENLKDFPPRILSPLNLEVRTADAFIADTLSLDIGRGVAAIRLMRERFKRPEKMAEALLRDLEAAGLTQTADVLRPYAASL